MKKIKSVKRPKALLEIARTAQKLCVALEMFKRDFDQYIGDTECADFAACLLQLIVEADAELRLDGVSRGEEAVDSTASIWQEERAAAKRDAAERRKMRGGA